MLGMKRRKVVAGQIVIRRCCGISVISGTRPEGIRSRVEDSSSSAIGKQRKQRVGQGQCSWGKAKSEIEIISGWLGFEAIPLGTERALIFVES
jgi:hypothetical protein